MKKIIEIKNLKGSVILTFEGANLEGANLYRANLYRANLYRANLYRANLKCANLEDANLEGANLEGANLEDANLEGANLDRANLEDANLRDANLEGANLYRANLYRANLYRANLEDANLKCANLEGANLEGANLEGCDLPNFPVCPESGSFIGWKKTKEGNIIKLLIPEKAKRTSSLVGRKCRAEYAEVLEGSGTGCNNLMYEVGKIVYPDKYDDDIRVECTHGIHFFITKKEAVEY